MAITFPRIPLPSLPFLKPRDTFGVDIGTSSIKVVYLKRSGPRFIFQAGGVIPLAETGAELSPQDRKNMVVSRLAEFIAKEKIPTKNVVGSLSGNQVVVRYVKFPKMTRDELRKTIQFEAEPYIPFDINDVDLGFQIMGDIVDEGQKKMDAILVAAKKEAVQARVEVFEDLSLRPVVMDVDTFALVNAYEVTGDPAAVETVLVVNVGASTTNVALIENHVPRVVRDVSIAGNAFSKSIQKNLSCDFSAAEDLKERYGLLVTVEEKERTVAENNREAIQVSSALSSVARELMVEIQKSIDFYVAQNPEKVVHRILLSGGTSALKNFDAYLQQELKVPVAIFNPLAGLNAPASISSADVARLTVAVGLAVRCENDMLK